MPRPARQTPAGDSSLLPAWGVWAGVGDVFPFTLGAGVWGFGLPLGPSLGRRPGCCPSGALPVEVLICGGVKVCAFFRGQRCGTPRPCGALNSRSVRVSAGAPKPQSRPTARHRLSTVSPRAPARRGRCRTSPCPSPPLPPPPEAPGLRSHSARTLHSLPARVFKKHNLAGCPHSVTTLLRTDGPFSQSPSRAAEHPAPGSVAASMGGLKQLAS